eukprot:1158969-Pelagomonas_calceolata.AAC.12
MKRGDHATQKVGCVQEGLADRNGERHMRGKTIDTQTLETLPADISAASITHAQETCAEPSNAKEREPLCLAEASWR